MNISIIGAGAGIGAECVRQALAKGHRVTALSTNMRATPDHPHLAKINGSATSVSDLKKALATADAVFITIGTKKKKATTLFSDTAKAFLQAAAEVGFQAPVLVITGFGAGESSQFLNFFMKTVIRLLLKDQYKDKSEMERLFTQSLISWEMVRPGMLTNGPLTQMYQVIPKLYEGMRIGKISRADVADFLISEAENPHYLFQFPALTK